MSRRRKVHPSKAGRGAPARTVARPSRWRLLVRRTLRLAGVAALAGGAFLAFAEWRVARAAEGRVYDSTEGVPVHDVALVFGTTHRWHGQLNPFYEARLDAAAELFRRQRVRGLLVSGDNEHRSYNEPVAMRNDLAARGVPAEFITCDFAGLRTLDSVQRAQRVFGQSRVVFVSQRFHLERALYLAQASGLEAVGFVAAEAPPRWAWRVRAREVLARGMAVLDVWLGRGPRFLGPSEPVALAPVPPL